MSGLYVNYRLPGSGNHLVDYPHKRDEDIRDVEEDTSEDEDEEVGEDNGEGVKD